MGALSYTLEQKAACETRVRKILDAYFEEPLRTHQGVQYYLIANLDVFPFDIEKDFYAIYPVASRKPSGLQPLG